MTTLSSTSPLLPYKAVLFDLDGVITPTADLHQDAWGRMFTAFFEEVGVEPYTDEDYFQHLDGRRRLEGINALLTARGLSVPQGEDTDSSNVTSVVGLGERKNDMFLALLEEGIAAYPGSVALLDALAETDIEIAIVSSSNNARPVLASAGLLDRFEVIVDGLVAHEQGLPGKPAGDTYVHAAELLGLSPADCVVVEDATSGVAAGKDGGFGLVLGVDRGAGRAELLAQGADTVVDDLAELI